jgi:hypothetical protein
MTTGHFLNDADRGKRNHYEKSLSTTNLKHNGQGLKLSLHGAWPDLWHGLENYNKK